MRWRLLAAFLGVMAVMLIAQDVPLASHLHDVERDRQLVDLERDAFVLAAAAAESLDAPDEVALANLRETVRAYAAANDRSVVVADARGVVVASAGTDVDVASDLAGAADIAAALRTESAAGDEEGLVSVAVPVLQGATAVGAVRLGTDADVVADRAGDKVRGLFVVGAISLGAAALAAFVMAGSVTRPLRRLQRGTERVAGGDFAEPVDDTEGPPEIRRLAGSFNAMAGRVSTLVERQRAFAADASHQLRTPLTALRLQLERTAQLVDVDPAGAHRNLEAATAETERLQRLIDGLLLLARTDVDEPVDLRPVDVADLVADRVAAWEPFGGERGVGVTATVAAAPVAMAAPGALEQILDNYLDNALEVAPPGTAVEVVATQEGAHVVLHVLDRGPGLTDEQLTTAFERFWRAPDAASGGTGLGLAIVARLAAASGGRASLAHRPGGGLDAAVVVPVAPGGSL